MASLHFFTRSAAEIALLQALQSRIDDLDIVKHNGQVRVSIALGDGRCRHAVVVVCGTGRRCLRLLHKDAGWLIKAQEARGGGGWDIAMPGQIGDILPTIERQIRHFLLAGASEPRSPMPPLSAASMGSVPARVDADWQRVP